MNASAMALVLFIHHASKRVVSRTALRVVIEARYLHLLVEHVG